MLDFSTGIPLEQPAVVIPWSAPLATYTSLLRPIAQPCPEGTTVVALDVTMFGVGGTLFVTVTTPQEGPAVLRRAHLPLSDSAVRTPMVMHLLRAALGEPTETLARRGGWEDDRDRWSIGPGVLQHQAEEGPGQGGWASTDEFLELTHDPQMASGLVLAKSMREMQPYWSDAARGQANPTAHREAQARLVIALGEATLLIPRKPLDDGSPPAKDHPGMMGAGVSDDATGAPALVACTTVDAVDRWSKDALGQTSWPTFEVSGPRAVEVALGGGRALFVDPGGPDQWWMDPGTCQFILDSWSQVSEAKDGVDLTRAHLTDAQASSPRLVAWLRQTMPGFPGVAHAVLVHADDGTRQATVCGLWMDLSLTAEEGDRVAAQVAVAAGRALEGGETVEVVRLHGTLLDRAQQTVSAPAYSRAG